MGLAGIVSSPCLKVEGCIIRKLGELFIIKKFVGSKKVRQGAGSLFVP